MKKLMLVLALCASAFAQPQTKVVEVRFLDINALRNFLGAFGVASELVPGSRFIALRGEGPSVAAAEEALKRIDVPRKNVELTFHILSASAQAGTEKLPADLDPVVKQL